MRESTPIRQLKDIYYYPNLNIFSDASTRKGPKNTISACYGVVAVCGDQLIDSIYKVHNNSNSAMEELRGVRGALELALKHRFEFPVINIFSDSLYSIDSLRKYPYMWKYDSKNNTYISMSSHKPIKNLSIITECFMMMEELNKTNKINIYYQKGHVSPDGKNGKLKNGLYPFKDNNEIDGTIDINLIRYISMYNNVVDMNSRSILMRTDVFKNNYIDGLSFYPIRQYDF